MIYKCKKEYEEAFLNDIYYFNDLNKLILNLKEDSIIYLEDEEYYGQFRINKPNIKLIGHNSIISFNASHGMTHLVDGILKEYGTTGSSTLIIGPDATNFYMEGITVKNTYIHQEGKKGRQAVALKVEAKFGIYKNSNFISYQDTLYIDNGFNEFINCNIYGDVDFIFGAGFSLIKDSTIHVLNNRNKDCYILAPSSNDIEGIVILNSKVFLDAPLDNVYLGRRWYPGGAKKPVMPKAMLFNVSFNYKIKLELITMHESDPTNSILHYYNVLMENASYSNIDEQMYLKKMELLRNMSYENERRFN